MTLNECREAAKRGLPVMHKSFIGCYLTEIRYIRIQQVGYEYNEKGEEKPFVQLLDKCGHSVTYADPAEVSLAIEFKAQESEDISA